MVTKNITVKEAAHFLGMHETNLHNLIRRGDFSDVAEAVPSITGNRVKCYIKSGAFLEKYGITWDDIEALRAEMSA